MEIALGASNLNRGLRSGHLDGIGIYTQYLLEGLRALQQRVTPYVFSDAAADGLADTFQRFPGSFGASLLGAALLDKPFYGASRIDAQVFHATDHHIPRLKGLPVVATLMDPVPLMRSDWVTPSLRGVKNWLFRRSAHWADQIIAISEYAAADLEHYFRIPRERITVVPLGVDARCFTEVADADRLAVLKHHGLEAGFFLFIGCLQPRKNVERLVAAHLSLPAALRKQHPLVIAGRNGWGVDALVANLNRLAPGGEVRWLDYISPADKLALLHSAKALVFPSLYEGFGLPVLEAFAAGLPVLTSSTTALPEVAGGAALLVDPHAVDAIAEGMARLTEDSSLCTDLVARGRVRARELSWERCVARTLEVYQKAISP